MSMIVIVVVVVMFVLALDFRLRTLTRRWRRPLRLKAWRQRRCLVSTGRWWRRRSLAVFFGPRRRWRRRSACLLFRPRRRRRQRCSSLFRGASRWWWRWRSNGLLRCPGWRRRRRWHRLRRSCGFSGRRRWWRGWRLSNGRWFRLLQDLLAFVERLQRGIEILLLRLIRSTREGFIEVFLEMPIRGFASAFAGYFLATAFEFLRSG